MKKRASSSLRAYRLAAADFYYGMDADVTAEFSGLTSAEGESLRKTSAYKLSLARLQAEDFSILRQRMRDDSERYVSALGKMVPRALMVLEESLNDPASAMKAATEILDRSGALPKVSRIQSQIEENHGIPDVSEKIMKEFHSKRVN